MTWLGVAQVSAAGAEAVAEGSAVLHQQITDGMWRNPASYYMQGRTSLVGRAECGCVWRLQGAGRPRRWA